MDFIILSNIFLCFQTMIKAMVGLKWNRVAVLYEKNTYGRGAVNFLQQRAIEENICISLKRALEVDNGVNSLEITNVLTEIVTGNSSRPSINGIIFIGDYLIARTLFITMKNSAFATVPIVMLSEGFGLDSSVFKEINGKVISKSKGSLALSPPYVEVTEFLTYWKSVFTNATTFQIESS